MKMEWCLQYPRHAPDIPSHPRAEGRALILCIPVRCKAGRFDGSCRMSGPAEVQGVYGSRSPSQSSACQEWFNPAIASPPRPPYSHNPCNRRQRRRSETWMDGIKDVPLVLKDDRVSDPRFQGRSQFFLPV